MNKVFVEKNHGSSLFYKGFTEVPKSRGSFFGTRDVLRES